MIIKTKVIDIIHAAIKEVWLNNIKDDYKNDQGTPVNNI